MRLIDGDTLIGKLKYKMKVNREENGVGPIGTSLLIEKVIEIVSEAKTVDCVIHGHWVPKMQLGCDPDDCYAECSCCGFAITDTTNKLPDICPKCGSKMDGD